MPWEAACRRTQTQWYGVFAALGAQAMVGHGGAFLAARAHPGPVTFGVAGLDAGDGKAVRDAADPDGQVPYLLAAAVHGFGAVLAERLIGPKTRFSNWRRCCES
jgi:hypothetical protein